MNYTISSSVSCLLALKKTLKFRISVGPSEVLVRPSDLCPDQSINHAGHPERQKKANHGDYERTTFEEQLLKNNF